MDIFFSGISLVYEYPLNMTTHHPVSLSLDEPVLLANEGKYGIPGPFIKIPSPSGKDSEPIRVKFSDLDQNRHVNNARYVAWIFDQLNWELLEKGVPRFFAIEYKQEVTPGDAVILNIQNVVNENHTCLVEGRLKDSRQICLKSKVVF